MDKKALKNLLNNILIFLAIFLVVNYFYNTFFNKPNVQTGIQFFTDKKEIALNDTVTAELQNYTDKDIIVKNTCPNPPLAVQTLTNGQWQSKTAVTTLPCEGTTDLTLKPGEKHQFLFKSWNHALFGELGQYKLILQNGDQTMESNTFTIVPQSFFGVIWTYAIYQPIYNALIFFTSILPNHDLGFAIILLTILIRTILLIPNQKALKSQKKLQMIQPKLNELKTKHGDDQQKIAQETMAIYKEHKVNPFGSCLPLIIQIPVLIGLFNVIQSGMDPNNNYLLYGNLATFDLSQIHTIFLGILDLTKVNAIVLPIIVGLLQFFQMKLSFAKVNKKSAQTGTPKSSEMDVANKTMTYMMPVMIAFFTASVPSGVGIYWAFSTIYGIIQQFVINKQTEQEHTQIKVVDSSSSKDKKAHYKEINEQRKAEKAGQNAAIIEEFSDLAEPTNSSSKSSDKSDDDQITIIKA